MALHFCRTSSSQITLGSIWKDGIELDKVLTRIRRSYVDVSCCYEGHAAFPPLADIFPRNAAIASASPGEVRWPCPRLPVPRLDSAASVQRVPLQAKPGPRDWAEYTEFCAHQTTKFAGPGHSMFRTLLSFVGEQRPCKELMRSL